MPAKSVAKHLFDSALDNKYNEARWVKIRKYNSKGNN